jgi:hypothetical protein
MLRAPQSILDRRFEILDDLDRGKLSRDEANRILCELEPDSALAHILRAETLLAAGDPESAEPEFWKVLALAPSNYAPYLALARIHTNEPLGRLLKFLGTDPEDAEDPAGAPWPERLLPYRILKDIERQAAGGLDPDLLREILDHPAECAPIFRAAVRQWLELDDDAPDDAPAALLIGLLGEIEDSPELIDELLEIDAYPTWAGMRHAHWAVHRVAQRHPLEAFEKFRAAAARAGAGFRGMVAEQLFLLPKTEGTRPAILALLADFDAIAPNPDAAYLLLTVATLAALRGSARDSLSILEKHRRKLDRDGRRWLDDALDAEEAFVPNLIAIGVGDATVEDVAIDRLFMDDDDEEYDDGDDDYEDDVFEEPAVAAPKPGRNDPCWCGSGRKYKKCHLTEDEEAERADAAADQKDEPDETAILFADLLRSAEHWHSRAEFLEANRLYFGCEAADVDTAELENGGFFEWYFLDYRPASTGRTLVQEYLRRRGPRLPDLQRALLEAWRGARFSIWEVQRIEKGRGVELKDRFAGDTVFLEKSDVAECAAIGDCFFDRIYEADGRWRSIGERVPLTESQIDGIAAAVAPGMTLAEFVRARSHEWHRIFAG